jgi:CheY-like chemotaxis protein
VGRRVLVVDDEIDLVELLDIVLSADGWTVSTATDGLWALEAVAREMPDVILLDMRMPILNGWEFAAALAARYPGHPPIVVMTAAAEPERHAAEIAAAGWIAKPFDVKRVAAELRRVLS